MPRSGWTDLGLVSGSSGNVSVRLPSDNPRGLLAVTPSGKRYSEMDEGDIVVADFNMEPVEGDLAPSSESLMHVAIYRSRPDVGAVIHTHSEFATVLAVAGLEGAAGHRRDGRGAGRRHPGLRVRLPG